MNASAIDSNIRNLRIALVLTTFPSTSQTFVLDQIRGLLDRGHRVKIFALRKQESNIHRTVNEYDLMEKTQYLNFTSGKLDTLRMLLESVAYGLRHHPPVLLSGFTSGGNNRTCFFDRPFDRLPFLLSFLKEWPFDLIHCHFADAGRLAAELVPFLPSVPLITSVYGHDVSRKSQIRPEMNQWLKKKATLVLSLSKDMDEKLREMGFNSNQIRRHRIGVDLEHFPFHPPQWDSSGPIQLLSVARLVPKKGLRYALEALSDVVKQSSHDIDYRIAGDGPLRQSLQQHAVELGVQKQVRFLGWKSRQDIRSLYQESDIFVLPSVTADDGDQEGTPTALMEAQACGLPVLSTWHSGIPEVVDHGKTGFLVEERNADELAKRLLELIGNPSCWKEMGEKGRERVENHFNIDRLNDELVHLYRNQIER